MIEEAASGRFAGAAPTSPSGTGGTGGAASVCVPGTASPCYDGPDGTDGVGICHAGNHTCAADGHGFDLCVGEQTPLVEDCATAADDDCDGTPNQPSAGCGCAGQACGTWSHLYGGMADDGTGGVRIDASGNVLATGFFQQTMVVGGLPPLVSAGDNDIFVLKLDPSGQPMWTKSFGAPGNQAGHDVAVDADSNVLVVGYFSGTVTFGPTTLTTESWGTFVVKLDATGTVVWAKSLPSGNYATMRIAVDPKPIAQGGGHVAVSGTWVAGNDLDVFLQAFASDGTTIFTKIFGDGSAQYGEDVNIDRDGNILLVGEISGSASFGGPALVSAGGLDGFVAKFDSAGNHLWSSSFGDSQDQYANSVAPDTDGNVAVCGAIYGQGDLGGGPLVSAGDADLFVAKFQPDGAHVWSKIFGDPQLQSCRKLAVDIAGNVVATGWVVGSVDFGGGALTSAGNEDLFVVKLDATGGYVWARLAGDAAVQYGQSIATGPSGEIVVGGWAEGAIDFGLGPVQASGGFDAVIAKLAP